MASTIILSDNGASSGSAGLKSTAGNDGVLILQTTTSGGTATNAVYIDTSQNVGIGTSSPSQKLDVGGTIQSQYNAATNDATVGAYNFYNSNSSASANPIRASISAGRENSAWGAYLSFKTSTGTSAAAEAVRITSAGVLTSTAGQISVAGTGGRGVDINGQGAGTIKLGADGTTYATSIMFYDNYASMVTPLTGIYAYGASGTLNWLGLGGTAYNAASVYLTPNGNVLIGTTTAGTTNSLSTTIETSGANNSRITVNHSSAAGSSNGSAYIQFGYGGTTIANITQASTTTVAYNTSSDYRLKENVQPMTGALEKVAALKPCTYTWKPDGAAGQGFIAHELAEVVPDCVTGEKDAVETYVDEDGNEQTRPVYQGIDTSFLVATLTAAIQEQQALINNLTERLAALEAK